jgi:hypothetical protein
MDISGTMDYVAGEYSDRDIHQVIEHGTEDAQVCLHEHWQG